MDRIGKQYTSIAIRREPSKAEEAKKPAAYEKFRSSKPESTAQMINLVDRKARQIETAISLRKLKEYGEGIIKEGSDERDIEIFHFLRDDVGLRIDDIPDEGKREIAKLLLKTKDIEFIKSILDNPNPKDAQQIIELYNKYPELLETRRLDPQQLATLVAFGDPEPTIKAFLASPNLTNLSIDELNVIFISEKRVEILQTLNTLLGQTTLDPMLLRGILISREPIKIIELMTKYSALRAMDIESEFYQLLTLKNPGQILDLLDQALGQEMPLTTIVATFYSKDPVTILKILINSPEVWKGQPADQLNLLNKLIVDPNLQYRFEMLGQTMFGKEIYLALSQQPDPEQPDFAKHKSKGGKEYPVAVIFYQDLNRQQIRIGDNPYWNDPNNSKDPLLSSEDLTSESTPTWKRDLVEQLRKECGYIEGGDKKANAEAMKKFENILTTRMHEWKERRINELLAYCGYIEGGDPIENQKAEQKAFMISCNCNQNIGFRMNNASFASKDTPLRLNDNNKFILGQGTYVQTLNLSKNEKGEILLTTVMKTNNLPGLQEFTPDERLRNRITKADIPNIFNMEYGITVTKDAEWKPYNGGIIGSMFALQPYQE